MSPSRELPAIGAPATRALAGIDVERLDQLSEHSATELLALHGFGPKALRLVTEALDRIGLSLRT